MISFETYQKIRELYDIGLSMQKISRKLHLAPETVKRWIVSEEETFLELQNMRFRYLDQYKEFMLEQIRACPQIKTTNLYFKTQDAFADFDCPRSAFYRYVLKLKKDYGFERFTGRQIQPREETPPGYEAQVDFGQSKIKDMYGRIIRVYFFCMVLSFSRMKFVYFSPEPFNTRTAIKAHEYAFRYFGGKRRPSCTIRTGCLSSAKTSAISSLWRRLKNLSRKRVTVLFCVARAIRRRKAKSKTACGTSRRISLRATSLPVLTA